jgi:hypothetical protein
LVRGINHNVWAGITSVHDATTNLASNLKARRNVDNFLEGCRRLGARSTNLCSSLDILQMRQFSSLMLILEELVKPMGDTPLTSV